MNITYNIIEKQQYEKDTMLQLSDSEIYKNNFIDNDNLLAIKTDYELNYNLSYLNSILGFYNIKKNVKKNMNKKEIIEAIVNFETNINNSIIVEERIKLFSNFIELKNHKFFHRFIIGSL